MISIIVAYAENRVIGKNGHIPWKIPEDLERFKSLTSGHPIIMGRKTHESIGRVLPRRTNIVVSGNTAYVPFEGARGVENLERAFVFAETCEGSDEIFVIGGFALYEHALAFADRVYATEVSGDFSGDAYFPEMDRALWEVVSREEHAGVGDTPAYAYVLYERKQVA